MFKRNMGSKERVARMVFGALLICTGVVAMHSSALGIGVAAVGGVSLITGIFSYCEGFRTTAHRDNGGRHWGRRRKAPREGTRGELR